MPQLPKCLIFSRSVEQGKSSLFPVTRRPGLFILSMVLAAAAMLVKEHGVTVLGVCFVYDIAVLGRPGLTR